MVKERGTSTLAGINIWYDQDVRRLNNDEHGTLLGEFKGDDKIVVWTAKNQYYITNFDIMQHFPDDTIRVEKYVAGRVYSVCYFDREQNFYYLKRFELESVDKIQYFLGEEGNCDFVTYCSTNGSKLEISYNGSHATRPNDLIDVDEFIAIKSHRAKGKRITTYQVEALNFIEAEVVEEPTVVDDVEIDDLALSDNEALETDSSEAAEGATTVVLDSQQLGLF